MKRVHLSKTLLIGLFLMGMGLFSLVFIERKQSSIHEEPSLVAMGDEVASDAISSKEPKLPIKIDNEHPQKKKVCLSMIVKDESHVIERCLATVKPIIDYWVIVDTGSTDGTQKIIENYMKDIPGEIHEHPWVDFAHNRNLALEYTKGKGDYALIIDADEMLEYDANFKMPPLDKDAYLLTLVRGNNQYALPTLCRTDMGWKWHGVLHEYLSSPEAKTVGHIPGVIRTTKSDGNRSKDSQKYQKDVKVLQEALVKEPNNDRYMFYLAQSFRDAGDYENSIETYRKRVAMGGWDQEVFYSLWQIAKLQDALNKDADTVIKAYTQAFAYRPSRAEPLNDLTKYYLRHKEFEKAYQVASIGKTIPRSNDILFVEKTVWDFDIDLQYAVAAYWIGKFNECRDVSLAILAKPDVPECVKKVVENNLTFANAKLIEQITK